MFPNPEKMRGERRVEAYMRVEGKEEGEGWGWGGERESRGWWSLPVGGVLGGQRVA